MISTSTRVKKYELDPEELDRRVNAALGGMADDDLSESYGDVKLVCDPSSAQMLVGATLDYTETIQETGFKINNPNAQRTCGCGSSFS